MGKTTDGQEPGLVSNGRRLFLLGMAGTAVVLSGCGGGGGNDTVTPAPNEPAPSNPDPDPDPDPQPPTQPPTPQPDSHPPRGLHVSLEDSTRRTRSVTWFSDGKEAPAQRLEYDQPEADWDPQSVQSRPFLKWVYARSEPTFGVEALTHRAMAPALDPRRPFRYRVGSPEGGWSRVYWLAPIDTQRWSFTHFGDHGISERAKRVVDESLKHPSDLLLLAGDLSYANGEQPIWDQWFDLAEPLLASTVTMAAAGNHEAKDGDGLSSGKAFKRFIADYREKRL